VIAQRQSDLGDVVITELIKRIEELETRNVQHGQRWLLYETELAAQRHAIDALQTENAEQQLQIQELDARAKHTDGEQEQTIREANHHHDSRHAPGRTIAFFAKLVTTPSHLGPNDTVVFEVAEANVGGAYDATRGLFTSPIPGTYVFSITITTFSIFNSDCGFAKNGERVTEIWINGKQNAFASNGQTILMHLQAGDVISVQQAGSESYLEGAGHSLFTGFLLFEDSLEHTSVTLP